MRLVALLAACCLAQAQIPREDSRNTETPATDTHFKAKSYATLAEWQTRREALRRQILSAAGLYPMLPKNDLHPQVFGRIAHPDYTVEKVLLETLPGFYLGGNLYRPLRAAPAGGFPAIVSPHGHWAYGRLENTEIASVPARCITLARQGYVVLSIDMVGYGDTIQTPHDFGDKPAEELWGFGPLGLQLWNSIRAVDFLESLPDVNAKKIGATGASGGATQTMLLAAVDDRIQFDAPANMVSLIMQGGGLCENAPNLRIDSNNAEVAAMMAPRPMIMTGSTGDWTRNLLQEELPAVRAIYDLYDARDKVGTFFQQAPHNYNKPNREAVYAFFGLHVLGEKDAAKLKEKNYTPERPENLLALHNRALPDNAITFAQLFDEWKRLAQAQTGDTRARLTAALAAELPSQALSEGAGEHIVLGREGRGDRIPAIWLKGANPPALVVSPEGAERARQSREVEEFRRAGRAVLLIDAFQTGSAVAPRKRDVRMFLTFNKSDDANRVQDILTALAWLKTVNASDTSTAPPRLVGLGKAAVWCLFAAAVSPTPVDLQADVSGFHGTDDEFIAQFFVPDIQRAGGLAAAKALVHQVQ
jgi:dienelactone hydrolase